MKKVYVLLFAALCMLIVSCSPSSHLGKTSIDKPAMTENDPAKWQSYYADQLDAYKGNVFAPASGYPEAASQGYLRAKSNWDGKVSKAATNSVLVEIGITLVATFLIFAVIIPGATK
jgi:hypothetical protein